MTFICLLIDFISSKMCISYVNQQMLVRVGSKKCAN